MSPTSGTVAPPPTEHSFADLGANATTLTSLARVGIEHPFPIQTLCLPLALAGVDLIGQARTGTGKTLAFGIPIVQEVDPQQPEVQALVVVPTRELCLQVAGDIDTAVVTLKTRSGRLALQAWHPPQRDSGGWRQRQPPFLFGVAAARASGLIPRPSRRLPRKR